MWNGTNEPSASPLLLVESISLSRPIAAIGWNAAIITKTDRILENVYNSKSIWCIAHVTVANAYAKRKKREKQNAHEHKHTCTFTKKANMIIMQQLSVRRSFENRTLAIRRKCLLPDTTAAPSMAGRKKRNINENNSKWRLCLCLCVLTVAARKPISRRICVLCSSQFEARVFNICFV